MHRALAVRRIPPRSLSRRLSLLSMSPMCAHIADFLFEMNRAIGNHRVVEGVHIIEAA